MRFRKTIFAETLDLLEDLAREVGAVVAGAHAAHQPLLEGLEPATPLPGGHRAAQAIRLARRKARRDHCELHHLFLKDRHAERALQDAFDRHARIGHLLLAAAAAQVRMHHVALDGAGPHERHLDDEIVVIARLQARQHRHLRARFDLKDTHRIGPADHVVDVFVIGSELRHR